MRALVKRILPAALMGIAGLAVAQDSWPSKPIRLVVPFPPGGAADAVARTISEKLSKELGQAVVIDNKAGGATTIASTFIARATPDGYTLYLGGMNLHGLDKVLYPDISYDGNKDFTPVTRWVSSPLVIVANKSSGINTIADLIKKAKAAPDKVAYASAGNGTVTHQAAVYFDSVTGAKLFHVPYRGGAPAVLATLSGDTAVTFATPPSVLPMIKAGKLQPLAVTSSRRSSLYPEIPSVQEAGIKGYSYTFWYGLYGPANLPTAIVNKLFHASQRALADPNVKQQLATQGMEPAPSASIAEFKKLIAEDGPKVAQIASLKGSKD
ncbi:Bug family tripartite tricarboxylate transporter substrate binding protein [Cupriavidus sp. 8B]